MNIQLLSKNIKILSCSKNAFLLPLVCSCNQTVIRNSSFQTSKPVGDLSQYTNKFEVTNNPIEWKFVEKLLPPKIVPKPEIKSEYPSGWKPQSDIKIGPYFIERTKNYMQPVYLERTYRGMRRLTKVRKIQGNIWKLDEELREHLSKINKKTVVTQVNEVSGHIYFKGDYVNQIKEWLSNKNF